MCPYCVIMSRMCVKLYNHVQGDSGIPLFNNVLRVCVCACYIFKIISSETLFKNSVFWRGIRIVGGCGLDACGSGQGPVADPSEHDS